MCVCVSSLWSSCFRPVSRTEAEVLLERHPDCGNMLLRPGRDGTSLAVTTRQDLNGYDTLLKHLYPYPPLSIFWAPFLFLLGLFLMASPLPLQDLSDVSLFYSSTHILLYAF